MKLVLAVVSNQAAEGITDALLAAGFRATRLASTGGFRREGNTVILLGVEDEDLDAPLAIFRSGAQTIGTRKPPPSQAQPNGLQPTGRGALYVLPLEDHVRL